VVRIATGKDAADTAFATIFGQVKMPHMNPIPHGTRALTALPVSTGIYIVRQRIEEFDPGP